MATPQALLDAGDINNVGDVLRKTRLGTILKDLITGDGTARLVRESIAVSSDAATPTYAIKALLYCEVTGGSAGNGAKVPGVRGGSVAAASAVAPNAGGTALAFKASEVTGASAVAEVIYITSAAKTLATGQVALTTDIAGKTAG